MQSNGHYCLQSTNQNLFCFRQKFVHLSHRQSAMINLKKKVLFTGSKRQNHINRERECVAHVHVIQGQIVMRACSNATRLSAVIYIGRFITHLANQTKQTHWACHTRLLARHNQKKVDLSLSRNTRCRENKE